MKHYIVVYLIAFEALKVVGGCKLVVGCVVVLTAAFVRPSRIFCTAVQLFLRKFLCVALQIRLQSRTDDSRSYTGIPVQL